MTPVSKRSISRHGAPAPVPLEAALSADPDLYLVTADMSAWLAAHPCHAMSAEDPDAASELCDGTPGCNCNPPENAKEIAGK